MTKQSTSDDTQKKSAAEICEKIVILLCGLPGAGKSTLAKQFIDEHCAPFSSIALIEYDDLQDSLIIKGEESDEQHMLQAWKASRTLALQTLCERLKDSTTKLLFLDDNFYLQSMRKQTYQLCQNYVTASNNNNNQQRVIHFGLIWMDTPVDVCLERNQQRPHPRRVPETVIYNMQHKWEAPSEKGFAWEKSILRLDGSDSRSTHLQLLQHYLMSQQFVWVLPREDPALEEARVAVARQETQASRAHQLDQYLRCCVQIVAQHQKQCAGPANQCRKRLLAELKQNPDWTLLDLEQAFVAQMKQLTVSSSVDWDALQSNLAKTLWAKHIELNRHNNLK
ncbi:O-phosphoseryl-tRNA(Sec) kinase [Fistulifera solaris]|uniref:O-phosphoseryl-tRNA(Sec) kinase n=1 Tax=Fistulifera solaris TaxID=1519565 RepID=A0A1Z5KNE8_FISSO|nr:O-phosphoseryl-tRNA(Sec) kinase [Fistulifera solaris]|eukprot:GAX27853.1 O-phosphoseryl-tRNA(Sec) kinase [Fistulifera solaris]